MNLQEEIEKLESQISSLSRAKRYLIHFAIFALISYLNYDYFAQDLIDGYFKEKENLKKVETELRNSKPRAIAKKIVDANKERANLEEKIEKLDFKKLNLQTEIDKKRFLLLTDEKFAQFLDITLKDSVNKGIILNKVKIDDFNGSKRFLGEVYLVKRLEFEGRGDYLLIEQFLRNIEKQDLLEKFEEITIERDVNLTKFNAKLLLYGEKE